MVNIRDAVEGDISAIVRLLADDALGATREDPSDPPAQSYIDAFNALTAQGGNTVLVATDGDTIIGCLQLTFIPGLSHKGMLRAQIEAVRVADSYRGRKIGEALVHKALARARDAGCGMAQLTTDRTRADAHRFYERLGFTTSHVGMKLKF